LQQSSDLLSQNALKELKNSKNLLAFSAGVDSSALFFLLLNNNIDFDIAIVDYQIRQSSKDEVAYAKELAKKYNKNFYYHQCKIDGGNFEKKARDIRYGFFTDLIKRYHYQNLITAHQLNDKLEWFLMQMIKGAGLVELLGFDEIENRDFYKIIRPLIETSKESLLKFLDQNSIKYFNDESNKSLKYKRNIIREKISNPLLREYEGGIRNSFRFLHNDKKYFMNNLNYVNFEELYIIKKDQHYIRYVDKILKKLGYVLSKKQRDEIERLDELVISNRYVISKQTGAILISPYSKVKMNKDFKDICRIHKIPSKIRPYIYEKGLDLNEIIKSIALFLH